MKTILTTFCLVLLLVAPSFAETGYISDLLIVTVRDQPSNSGTVLTTVRTGAPLEVIEKLEGFLRVRTDGGVEGYVRSQYVTQDTPKATQIKQLKTANAQLQQQLDQFSANLKESRDKTKNLSKTEEELSRLREEYQKLQKISATALQTTRERDELQQENNDLAGRMQQLTEESNLYLRTGAIKWFLAGAGVLCFGWILGKISRKKKRNYL